MASTNRAHGLGRAVHMASANCAHGLIWPRPGGGEATPLGSKKNFLLAAAASATRSAIGTAIATVKNNATATHHKR